MNQTKNRKIEPFLLGIGLMFLVVFFVNGAFVYYSLHSFSGLVTDRAYDKGLAFNTEIRAKRDQDALGWQAEVDVDLLLGISGRVEFTLKDRSGLPLVAAQVQAVLFRPVQAGFDQSFSLNEIRSGVYQGWVMVMQPGQWDLRIKASSSLGVFRFVQRIHVPLAAPVME